MALRPALLLLLCLALPLRAGEARVSPGPGALQVAIAGAEPGDVLVLAPGRYPGAVTIDKSLTLAAEGEAVIDGEGAGTVLTIAAPDVTVRGLTITGSGLDGAALDAGVKILKKADRALIEGNAVLANLHGIDIHGGRDARVIGNRIEGLRLPRMNDRGNGVYVWNSPGALVEGNTIRWGRDGLFANATRKGVFRGNTFRDLRFAVHYMYTNDSELTGNISIGNHLGFAIMFSDRSVVADNISLSDRDYGFMLNFANSADISGNLARGAAEKCLFIYNSNKNLIAGNRFEGCGMGIHFTAGSERNALTGNSFIGNREQVKYVGTRDVEWSYDGRGNYWSDHPAFDLNGDGLADGAFRPNDLMDHILWSQPAAALLNGAPAVQLVRWAQSSFPAVSPGGVVDSFPLMAPKEISAPEEFIAIERAVADRWQHDGSNETDPADPLAH